MALVILNVEGLDLSTMIAAHIVPMGAYLVPVYTSTLYVNTGIYSGFLSSRD